MRSAAIFLLSLVAMAAANVFITSPVASTVCPAGQNCTIQWQDDGKTPTLQAFGLAKVSIYVGNAIQQTSVQSIVSSVNVSSTSSILFVPDATIGPNSPAYFIRIESLALKDAANPQFPALAFSAKFTLTGMTGKFTAQEQSQIDGASTAPLGGSTTFTSTTSTSTGSSSSGSRSSSSSSGSSSSTRPSSTSTSGAISITVGKFVTAVFAGVVGLAMLS